MGAGTDIINISGSVLGGLFTTEYLKNVSINLKDSVYTTTNEGTTTVTIQRFKENYSITATNVVPGQPIEPLFPTDMFYIDEANVKQKIIAEFEDLGKGEDDYTDLGILMYNYFVPDVIRDYINRNDPKHLMIVTPTEHDIPWEFMHNGKDFWCTKYNMGRVLGVISEYSKA